MNSQSKAIAAVAAALNFINPGLNAAPVIVYDNTSAPQLFAYSEPNAKAPVFGDALNLLHGGILNEVTISLANSSAGGNTGTILTGTTVVNLYDNTAPYAGGAVTALPLLGSASLPWDFTGDGGLPAGFAIRQTFDVLGLNISLPDHIFVTQQFTELTGDSIRNGAILVSADPTVGKSPNTVYLKSSTTAEGLYSFGGPNQFRYRISVAASVPDGGGTIALFALGLLPILAWRRRSQPRFARRLLEHRTLAV